MHMVRKVILGTLGALLIAIPAAPVLVQAAPMPGASDAIFADFKSDACGGIGQIGNGGCGANNNSKISGDLKTIVNLLSIVAGFAAVVMIIISGIKFITAQGEASSVSSARSSLVYALIGLVVVAVAQFLVHFVLGKT